MSFIKDNNHYAYPLVLLCVFFTLLFIYSAIYKESNTKYLTVAFLDVGQGDSILIEAPNGAQMLIDAGASKDVLNQLSEQMSFYDDYIDVVVATHPDLDHVGGIPYVMANYRVGKYGFYGSSSPTETTSIIDSYIDNNSISREELLQGDRIILDASNDVYADVLFPDTEFVPSDSNDGSIILRLVYGETEVLLTGDASKKVEQYLVSIYGDKIKSDVLKVGHHGSKTSTSEEFLGFVSPDFGIISSGFENKFGHPHVEVIKSLEDFDVEILETEKLGTVILKSDGEKIWFQ